MRFKAILAEAARKRYPLSILLIVVGILTTPFPWLFIHFGLELTGAWWSALGIAVECGQDGAGCGYPAETVALAAEQAGYAGNDPEEAVQALLDARAAARKARDWGTADAIRDGLKALGLVIEDTPQGARVTMAG